MSIEITPAFMKDWFGPLALTPDQVRQVHQDGPGTVITADLAERRYRVHAPGTLDPTQNARLVVFTHHNLQLIGAQRCNQDGSWADLADETTKALRLDMCDWPANLFISPTVLALRTALAFEGFLPHTRPYVTSEAEIGVIDTLVFTPDPRVLMTTCLPAFTHGPATCEAKILTHRHAPLVEAQGPVCTDNASDIAQGLAAEARAALPHL